MKKFNKVEKRSLEIKYEFSKGSVNFWSDKDFFIIFGERDHVSFKNKEISNLIECLVLIKQDMDNLQNEN